MAEKRRYRSKHVAIGLAALLAGGGGIAYATTRDRYDYNAVCADRQSWERVSDEQCSSSSQNNRGYGSGSGSGWYYFGARGGTPVGGIGQRLNGGSFSVPPAGASVGRNVIPASGGSVKRGGFGGSSRGSAVGG